MSEDADRRAELIAAALTGELTPAEHAEFTELALADPTVWQELTELREVLGQLDGTDRTWVEAEPPTHLGDRVATVAEPGSAGPNQRGLAAVDPAGGAHRPARRPRWVLAAAAAAAVVIGIIGTVTYQGIADAPVAGPPGTLGAAEEITFAGEPPGSRVEASVVAHTWGTETVLELEGLELGETFEVVLVSATGEQLSSGTFIGTEATVLCRMNAAILREDVVQVRIISVDESVHLVADLPTVST